MTTTTTCQTTTERVYNFSPGPAVLPVPVLERARDELVCLPGAGASVLEISHRSKRFEAILHSAEARLRSLLQVPDDYRILFLQGGARLQFSMIPMNLLGQGQSADWVLTGSWGKKAREEAVKVGAVRIVWDGKSEGYRRVPRQDELQFSPDAAYAYITSNETIEGVQFPAAPDTGDTPLVCDASSDFLSRPVPVRRYGLLYACAQKNAGPAGVTIVIIRQDLLQRSADSLPGYLNFRTQAENNSLYNTPPTFAVYLVDLVAQWLRDEIGGLEAMERVNQEKARLLYETIDSSDGFYAGHADPGSRSMMNVTFRLPSGELESHFLRQAGENRLCELKGHRSVGGIRASIYNAMPRDGVKALSDFMRDFLAKYG